MSCPRSFWGFICCGFAILGVSACSDDPECRFDTDCHGSMACRGGRCVDTSCQPSQTHETSCGNNLDDDCNGLKDCADPACDGLACDDGNPSTGQDTCKAGICKGAPSENPQGPDEAAAEAQDGGADDGGTAAEEEMAGEDGSILVDDGQPEDDGQDAGNDDAGGDQGVDAGTDEGVDAGADPGADAGTDEGVDAGMDGGDQGLPCTTFSSGLVLTQDTLICSGQHTVSLSAGSAAMVAAADGITVTCDGTVIRNNSGYGISSNPHTGILIQSRSAVRVVGCAFHGFRYGALVRDSSDVIFDNVNVDDNYTDPNAGWVWDDFRGGGILFEGANGGAVNNGSGQRNFNGVELRSSNGVTVSNYQASHCSNTGAIVLNSYNNILADCDFSWGIRGSNLSYPNNWYGVDTRDSAGIILDASSANNQILRNNTTYGGDGIFLRSVFGGCAEDNLIEGNDTSFSPHNAIECWCDGNIFRNNEANDSHYGIWTGGMDYGQIVNNRVLRNKIDGISIQIGEDRNTVIQDNVIQNNLRCGILLTGREIQAWHDLSYVGPNLANSSNILVQRNRISGNGQVDLFVSSSRQVAYLSNCGAGTNLPTIRYGYEDEGQTASGIYVAGSCDGAVGRSPPSAGLSVPASVEAGHPFVLDGSASALGPDGGSLTYVWLLQPSGVRFADGTVPPWIVLGPGPASQEATIPGSGYFDTLLIVHDGFLGDMASATTLVLPVGTHIGESASDWAWACEDFGDCVTTISDVAGLDANAVQIVTNAPFDFNASTPPAKNLGLPIANYTTLAVFIKAENNNANGWQGNFPMFKIGGPEGLVSYTPFSNLLPTVAADWLYFAVPLSGQEFVWEKVQEIGTEPLSQIDWVEVHTDTWGGDPYTIWLDAMTLF